VIRDATPADAALLHEIEAAAGPTTWSVDGLRDTLGLPSTRALVRFDGATAVGHTVSAVSERQAEIVLIAVRPEHQRRGHASALLYALEEVWAEADTREAFLEVRAGNAPAIGLYRRHGWVDVGVRRRYYRDGEDARVMTWRPR
jgi:ribosomal-protein-alanine N-acetyltransferase